MLKLDYMTEKLFLEDSYLKEFEAEVVNVNDKYIIWAVKLTSLNKLKINYFFCLSTYFITSIKPLKPLYAFPPKWFIPADIAPTPYRVEIVFR